MNRTQHAIVSGSAALIAVTFVYLASRWTGLVSDSLILVAPAGASAILLFGAHASPLSQPRVVLASHFAAGFIGVSAAKFLPGPILPLGVAIGLTLVLMIKLDCLHPPAGATSLLAVTGGDAIHSLGYGYLFTPVLLDVSLLVLAAYVLNNLLPGRRYPFHPVTGASPEPQPPLTQVCRKVMTPPRVVLAAGQTVEEAWQAMMAARVACAPVVAGDQRVVGVLSLTDLLPAVQEAARAAVERIDPLIRKDALLVQENAPLTEAMAHFTNRGGALLPVVARDGALVGILTRRSLLATLSQASPRKKPAPA